MLRGSSHAISTGRFGPVKRRYDPGLEVCVNSTSIRADLSGLAVVFDLDGTLIDTAPDLLRSLDHVLETHGLPGCDAAWLRPQVGLGVRHMLEAAFGSAAHPIDEPTLERATDLFLAHYADNIAVGSAPFPGLVEALDALEAAGARLGVCTNKREHLSLKLLDELGLAKRFASVAGADTFPVRKPDPGHLTGTIARLGGSPANAVMVGDSATDVITAKAAGVPVIAVTFGYTETPAAELGADRVIEHYAELRSAVDAVLVV